MTCILKNGIYTCDDIEDVTTFDLLYMSKEFQAPTDQEVKLIEIDDYLQLGNGREVFYIKVIDIDYCYCHFTGIIQDDLKLSDPLSQGDRLKIHKFNIYSIKK
jgi:hypothetical protein